MRYRLPTLPWRAARPTAHAHRDAAALIAALPAYQVALWPDGWELDAGAVLIRETHAMAEARRWYQSRDRRLRSRAARLPTRLPVSAAGPDSGVAPDGDTGADPKTDLGVDLDTTRASRIGIGPGSATAPGLDRTMRLHGVFVPRPVVALAGQRFATEAAASVALQLIAGDWIAAQRQALLAAPRAALALRAHAWCGSRHRQLASSEQVAALIAELIGACVQEGLAAPAACRVQVRADAGFELHTWRCRISADLDPADCARLQAALDLALIPWNRALIRDGAPTLLLRAQVIPAAPGAGRQVASQRRWC